MASENKSCSATAGHEDNCLTWHSSTQSSLATNDLTSSSAETQLTTTSMPSHVALEREATSADIIGSATEAGFAPFNFVAGNVSQSRFNPFKQKSGLLNVLSKTTTKKRILRKSGGYNTFSDSYGKRMHLIKDIFHYILDFNWFWIMVSCNLIFFVSWLIFAVLWYAISWQHGDFEEENLNNSSFIPCVTEIKGFGACFLFSMETQQTIGYGIRAATDQCQLAAAITGIQSIIGCIIQAFITGIIFAKFTIPKARGDAVLFSRNALITLRNGALHLIIQITDMRKYTLISAQVRMILVHKKRTLEGETIAFYRTELPCSSEVEEGNDNLFLLWPTVVGHKIDEKSPFFKMGPSDFLKSKFEIIVLVEGTTQETCNTIQARSSYRPVEVLWGRRFTPDLIKYNKMAHLYEVQHTLINNTTLDGTPRISAYEMMMQ